MKITVIVATHKKYRMPHEKCYLPLHVGRGIGRDISFAGDDTGESISWKNPYYCELTGLYWMWKFQLIYIFLKGTIILNSVFHARINPYTYAILNFI